MDVHGTYTTVVTGLMTPLWVTTVRTGLVSTMNLQVHTSRGSSGSEYFKKVRTDTSDSIYPVGLCGGAWPGHVHEGRNIPRIAFVLVELDPFPTEP